MTEDLTVDHFRRVLQQIGSPVVTTADVAAALDMDREAAEVALEALSTTDAIGRRDASADPIVWYPKEWEDRLSNERIVLFPDRRELVVDQPDQFTRAQLSQFAHLIATSGRESYLYRIRPVDIWHAPYQDYESLARTIRDVIGGPPPAFMDWIEEQWRRARQFTLLTHPDDYTVLSATTPALMANVARQELSDDYLRASISETESWVAEEYIADIKRTLYEAGFPVRDDRELERGDPLNIELQVELRAYQRTWVDRFMEEKSGVLVGPPGSGKTVAALGILERVGGETLILVPSRELATQWRERILADTNLSAEQVGEYHGGVKQLRPVTIATYHTAGMDRHRLIFEDRKWGVIGFDECLSGDTTIETIHGQRTFTELADAFALSEGWNTDIDLAVRTFDPVSGNYRVDSVHGIYTTVAPVQQITTQHGDVLRATRKHNHLVGDPETGEITEQEGIAVGDYLVRPSRPREPTSDTHTRSNGSALHIRQRPIDEVQGVHGRSDHTEPFTSTIRDPEAIEFVRVEAVTPGGIERVYDFETGTHTFLANGFLTHNCHHIPAEVFRRTTDLQSRHRLGLTASPVRGDDKEDEIFTLIGPPIGTDWAALLDAGFVIEPELEIRYLPWGSDDAKAEFDAAEGHERRQLAGSNPAKLADIRRLRARHEDEPVLIFVDWLEQGETIADALEIPFISGETPHPERERLFQEYRAGQIDTLVVSRVGDEGIDLPDASIAILASGLGGSRRQGTQRVGRTMRPAGNAKVYVLATRGTREEDFALNQLRHLRTKGMKVAERTVELENNR